MGLSILTLLIYIYTTLKHLQLGNCPGFQNTTSYNYNTNHNYNDKYVSFDEDNIIYTKQNLNSNLYNCNRHVYVIIFRQYFFNLWLKMKSYDHNCPNKLLQLNKKVS